VLVFAGANCREKAAEDRRVDGGECAVEISADRAQIGWGQIFGNRRSLMLHNSRLLSDNIPLLVINRTTQPTKQFQEKDSCNHASGRAGNAGQACAIGIELSGVIAAA
jgi:hypothetical protein